MISAVRVDLTVPYREKDRAKSLGARWDGSRKTWYASPGADLDAFAPWLPACVDGPPTADHDPQPGPSGGPSTGVTLSTLLSRVRLAIEEHGPGAEWVRAEISELREKGGNYYIELVERDELGRTIASASAKLWKNVAPGVLARFREGVGGPPSVNMKVLLRARVDFHVSFGFGLIVDDIDPSYTVGDLLANLRRIRRTLADEALSDRNGKLPAPADFVRVAVISPSESAGLDDFRREADLLEAAGLCSFRFLVATFQGNAAPGSIVAGLREAFGEHAGRPFDALAIIRGGGAVADLAWLNDLDLAREVCTAPLPVFTGIGHQRDSTILDEVAHRSFDTPSKVSRHIAETIRDNAVTAIEAVGRIRVVARQALALHTAKVAAIRGSILDRAESRIDRSTGALERSIDAIRRDAATSVEDAVLGLANLKGRALAGAASRAAGSRRGIDDLRTATILRTASTVAGVAAGLASGANAVRERALARLDAARSGAESRADEIGRESRRSLRVAEGRARGLLDGIAGDAIRSCDRAAREIESGVGCVIGLGPGGTLKRGYAIARSATGGPITSRQAASREAEMELEFRDGTIRVAPLDDGEDRA